MALSQVPMERTVDPGDDANKIHQLLAVGRGKLFLTLAAQGLKVIADVTYDHQTGLFTASWHPPRRGTVRMEYNATEILLMNPEAFK